MAADNMERRSASPVAGAPAGKPQNGSEHRKSSKPIMEKRRRARINDSLGQLKTLILQALKKDNPRHAKLEKADILEMTVKHLRNLQRVQMTAVLSANTNVLSRYRAGFNECMNEVTRFLSACDGMNAEVRSRLLRHLSGCLGQMFAVNCPQPGLAQQTHPAHVQLHSVLPISSGSAGPKLGSSQAVSPKVFGGLQLVPTTDGQFAFIIPSPSATNPVVPLYADAGVRVTVDAGPVQTSSALTVASPVRGLTSFTGVSKAATDPVWRPW